MTKINHALVGGVAALAGLSVVSAACNTFINSLPYCEEVSRIVYNNVGFEGTYDDVVAIDPDACTCTFAPKSFSGKYAPLNEQLSLHARGPMNFNKFAVYTPGGNSKRSEHARRHAHGHHAHHAFQKRAETTITLTSTTTVYVDGNSEPTPPPSGELSAQGDVPDGPEPEPSPEEVQPGGWTRKGYYCADDGISEGLTFMNHQGGQGSGKFTQNCFGNSLSFADSIAKGGSAESTILEKVFIPSQREFVVYSDEKCDESCGVWQPGVPAFKGFGGDKKVFLMQFSMPRHTDTPTDFNRDMPAIWFLNAKIARTAQYGKQPGGDGLDHCSCWKSGCGELDVFEVLTGATDYVKTHYHSQQGALNGYGGGGSPAFFRRPFDAPVVGCVVFDGTDKISINILPGDTEFPESFDDDFLQLCAGEGGSSFDVPV